MPRLNIIKTSKIESTPRVKQMSALFDVVSLDASQVDLSCNLPIEDRDWNIGLIVGPSGAGKTIKEPLRDRSWQMQYLRHKNGRIII